MVALSGVPFVDCYAKNVFLCQHLHTSARVKTGRWV